MVNEQSLKDNICPDCGEPLVCMTSLYKKVYAGCNREYKWPLDEGQKNVYT